MRIPSGQLWSRSVAVVFGMALSGCPGSAVPAQYDTSVHNPVDEKVNPLPDKASGNVDHIGSKTEFSIKIDQRVLDLKVSVDTLGGSCPCNPPLACVTEGSKNVCRSTCQTATCNALTNCPAGYRCNPTTAGAGACIPAVGPGQACGTSGVYSFCQSGYQCLIVGSVTNPAKCYQNCTGAGAPCGNCTDVPGSPSNCKYCP
jgi:hypothetical protein